jgi:hypothetical protein
MKIVALKSFRMQTSKGLLELQKGQTLDLPPEKAQGLILRGLIFPQRLLSAYGWCLDSCMLTKEQAQLCERIKPFPCWKFQREFFFKEVIQ